MRLENDEEDIMPTHEKDVTYNGRVEIHAGSLCLVTERSKGLNECYTSYGTFPKDLPNDKDSLRDFTRLHKWPMRGV